MKYHIARMQILLDDLGSADSMYRNMYQSSVDSAGSAMEENEKFMDSLQARINLARVEVEKLALSMGEAFLTESMITGIQLFGDFLGIVTKFVDKFGVLPALMGTTGVALFLLSSRFKTLAGSIGASITSLLGFRGAASASATVSAAASGAVRGLSIAFKGLLASTGVGLALVGVGIAIEGLLGIMGKQRELQEEMEQSNRLLTESYSANRDTVQELASEYATLEEAMKTDNASVTTQEKYYDVQNKLVELMPSLLSYEDSYGNKIAISSTAVESKIAMLEKQIDAEERLQSILKETEDAELLAANRKIAEDKTKKADTMLGYFNQQSNNNMGNEIYDYKPAIKNLQDMEAAIIHFEEQRALYAEAGSDGISKKMGRIADDLRDSMQTYNRFTAEADSAQLYVAQKAIESAEAVIAESTNMSDATKELASNMLNDFTAMAESGEEAESIANVFADGQFEQSLKEASLNLGKFTSATEDEFENQKALFIDYSKTLKESLLSNVKGSDGNFLEEDSAAYASAGASIQSWIDKMVLREEAVKKYAATHNVSMEQARLGISLIDQEGASLEESGDKIAEYIAKLRELSSVEEQMVGVSQSQIDAVNELVYMYQTLSGQTNLTAGQTLALKDAEEKLKAIYPELSKFGFLRIDSIIAEKNAQEILLNSVKLSKEGKLTAEEDMTLSSALGTKARIDNIKTEMEAMLTLFNQYMSEANRLAAASKNFNDDMNAEDAYIKALKARNFEMTRTPYQEASSKLNGYIAELNTSTGALKSATGYQEAYGDAADKSTKSTKDSTKATKESIYITDKYKQALESINAEIAKQQSLRSTMTDYSKEYRDSLQREIKLEKDKKKLMEDQAAALEKQIKSGKIAQTGNISSSSTTTTKNLNGWGGSVTSNYGTRTDPFTGKKNFHAGVDLAGKKGTRLDANISGKVVQAGNNGNGFGNYVTIQAEDGMKHIYAHLDKVVATLGQTITAGMQVGTIGSTGRSTGSHLHYEVRNSNNKAINPDDYMQEAKSGKVTTNSTASGITNAQQAIDQAKSDLLALRRDIAVTGENIEQKQYEVINSQLTSFEKRHNDLQHNIDDEIQKRQKLNSTSQEYHDSIKNQISRTEIQIQNYENEKAYLNALINSTETTSKVKAELTERVKELSLAIVELNINNKNSTFERIQATMKRFAEELDDVGHSIAMSQANLDLLDEDSVAHTNGLKNQIPLLEKQKKLLQEQEASLQRSLKIHELTPEQVKEIKEQMEDLSLAILDVDIQTKQLRNTLNSQIADSLSKIKDGYIDGLKKESEKVTESIEKAIEDTEKYYDSLIDKQQERLDALDEEIEKVDRLKALQEIDDEINKTKNDKRFSYITAEGEEVLTYNKERVSELEKQRNEMLQQYQREDVKKSIQDEIDRLERARTSKVETMRKELEDTKLHYEQLIASETIKWDGLIESAQTGTLGFSTIMDEFYGTSLTNLSSYASDIQSQIASIQAAFAALSEMKPPPIPDMPEIGTGVSYTKPSSNLKKYHDGGIVGDKPSGRLSELTNKLFNTKPNEQVVKSLIGEIQIPPHNIPNLFTNINSMIGKLTPRQQTMQPAGDTITLHIDKVIADNPKQFLNDLDMYIRMNKS